MNNKEKREKNIFLKLWVFSVIGLFGLFIVGTLTPKGTESAEMSEMHLVSWEPYCSSGELYTDSSGMKFCDGASPTDSVYAQYRISVHVWNHGLDNVKSPISCITSGGNFIGSNYEDTDCELDLSEINVSDTNFLGWSLDGSCNNPKKDKLTVDIDSDSNGLFPCFDERTAKFMIYNSNTKEFEEWKSVTKRKNNGTYSIDVAEDNVIPTRDGYVFAGWQKDGGEQCFWENFNIGKNEENSTFYPCWVKEGATLKSEVPSTLTLENNPQYDTAKNSIIFNVDGENGTTLKGVRQCQPNASDGNKCAISLRNTGVTKRGYTLIGWQTGTGGICNWISYTVTPKEGQTSRTINLYPCWISEGSSDSSKKLTLEPNGGKFSNDSTAPKDVFCPSGDKNGLFCSISGLSSDENKPSKEYYNFKGWSIDDNCETKYKSVINITGESTYHACWEPKCPKGFNVTDASISGYPCYKTYPADADGVDENGYRQNCQVSGGSGAIYNNSSNTCFAYYLSESAAEDTETEETIIRKVTFKYKNENIGEATCEVEGDGDCLISLANYGRNFLEGKGLSDKYVLIGWQSSKGGVCAWKQFNISSNLTLVPCLIAAGSTSNGVTTNGTGCDAGATNCIQAKFYTKDYRNNGKSFLETPATIRSCLLTGSATSCYILTKNVTEVKDSWDNHTLVGWQTEKGGVCSWVQQKPSENVDYYPCWVADRGSADATLTYTLTLNPNEGKFGSSTEKKELPCTASSGKFCDINVNLNELKPTKENGDKFTGWGLTSDCKSGYTKVIYLDKNREYFACWEENSPTGGSGGNDNTNEEPSEPSTGTKPARTATFKYRNSDNTEYLTYTDECTWNPDGTSCYVSLSKFIPTPSDSNYVFAGWRRSDNDLCGWVKQHVGDEKATSTFYPCWVRNGDTSSYTTRSCDEGDTCFSATLNAKFGSNNSKTLKCEKNSDNKCWIPLSGLNPVHPNESQTEHYTLIGWRKSGSNICTYTYLEMTENKEYYPCWAKQRNASTATTNDDILDSTLTLDLNGGKFGSSTENKTIDCPDESGAFCRISTLGADENVPSRSGYTFKGWGTSSTCTSGYKTTVNFNSDTTLYACWKPIYTASFYIRDVDNDNDWTLWDELDCEYNSNGNCQLDLSKVDKIRKDGYVLAGWQKSTGGQCFWNNPNISADTDFRPCWVKEGFASSGSSSTCTGDNCHTAKFMKSTEDGWGTFTTRSCTPNSENKCNISLKDVKNADGESLTNGNLVLIGWQTGFGNVCGWLSSTVDDDNTKFYPCWVGVRTNGPSYSLTLNPKGGKIDNSSEVQTVTCNVSSGTFCSAELPTPTRSNYDFKGWSTSESCDPIYKYKINIDNNDTTLYACWETKPTYTAKFMKKNDAGVWELHDSIQCTVTNSSGECGINVEDVKEITKSGSLLAGWRRSGDNQCYWKNFNIGSTQELYPCWVSVGSRSLTTNSGGGAVVKATFKSGDWIKEKTCKKNSDGTCFISLTDVNPTKSGYKLVGWKRATSDRCYWYQIEIGSNLEYTPCWVKDRTDGGTYTLTFDPNGGSGSSSTKSCTVTSGTFCKISNLPTLTRSNYTFKGWGTSKTCTNGYTTNINIDGNKTYYACWVAKNSPSSSSSATEVTYTATFNSNGGVLSGGTEKTCKATSGSSCTITALPEVTRGGYIFNGWGTNKSCTSGHVDDLTLSKSDTYYACWTVDSSDENEDDDENVGTNSGNGNSNNNNNNNVDSNPQTGNIVMFVIWIVGILGMGYSVYYFKQLKNN